MEEPSIGAVELIQSIKDVLACMAMHNVQQNNDTMFVTFINKCFEFIGCTISTEIERNEK